MHRFAYTNPMIMTCLFLAPEIYFAASLMAGREFFSVRRDVIYDTLGLVSVVAIIGWPWSVYEIATARRGVKADNVVRLLFGSLMLAFFVAMVGAIFSPADVRATPEQSVLVLPVFASLVGCFWKTADALICAEEVRGVKTFHRAETFALIFILVIGVWFLYRRVRALKLPEKLAC